MSLSSSTTAMRAMAPAPRCGPATIETNPPGAWQPVETAAPEGSGAIAALDRSVAPSANAASPGRRTRRGTGRAAMPTDSAARAGARRSGPRRRPSPASLAAGGLWACSTAASAGRALPSSSSSPPARRLARRPSRAAGRPAASRPPRRGCRPRPRRCPTGWWSSTATTASPSTTAAFRALMTEALSASLAIGKPFDDWIREGMARGPVLPSRDGRGLLRAARVAPRRAAQRALPPPRRRPLGAHPREPDPGRRPGASDHRHHRGTPPRRRSCACWRWRWSRPATRWRSPAPTTASPMSTMPSRPRPATPRRRRWAASRRTSSRAGCSRPSSSPRCAASWRPAGAGRARSSTATATAT